MEETIIIYILSQIYQVTTENLELKKQRHAQDDKMKKLATKILRLKSDMKKLQGTITVT